MNMRPAVSSWAIGDSFIAHWAVHQHLWEPVLPGLMTTVQQTVEEETFN